MVDWPGLLKWSTKYHDGTAPSEFKRMTDEDKKFLEAAMADAFSQIEDPNKIMGEAIGQIKAADRSDESISTALEIIDRCCDDPDCARNCEKLDGLQPLLDLLSTTNDAIRDRSLEIFALLFSNNPNIQEAGVRRGALDIFLGLVRESGAGSDTRSKAFRALVALMRNVQAFEEQFLKEKDGINVIISCLEPSDLRLCEKAASLIRSLADNERLRAEDVTLLVAALTPLMSTVGTGQIQYRETLSSCITQLAKDFSVSNAELKVAAEHRLKELPAAADEDADANERANLQEFLSFVSTGATAAA